MEEAGEAAREFLKKTEHLLTGHEKLPEIIDALKRLRDQREQTIIAYEKLFPREEEERQRISAFEVTSRLTDEERERKKQFEVAYKVAVQEKRKVDDLLRQLA